MAIMFARGLLRATLATGLAITGFQFIAVTSSYAVEWPICMQEESATRCDYVSYRQCRAASKDIGGSCRLNPVGWGYQDAFASVDRPGLSAASEETIRAGCIAQAQAQYPENGFGPRDVMTHRTVAYRICAVQNGIRP